MKDLEIRPLKVGSQEISAAATKASFTNKGRGASDVAIAEQFCTVASDLRSILQTLKTSVELQREMVISLDTNSKKLDESISLLKETAKGIEKTTQELEKSSEIIEQGINKNDEHIQELNKNSRLIVRSIVDENDYETLHQKVDEELKRFTKKKKVATVHKIK